MAMLFYYKNDVLIDSLSAQIFAGLLKEVSTSEKHDESNTIKSGGSGEAGLSVGVAKGKLDVQVDGASSTTDSDGRNETIIPHDARALDVLATLAPSMKTDLGQAKRGDVIHLQGALFFIPKVLENNSVDAILPIIKNLIGSSRGMDQSKKRAIEAFMGATLKNSTDSSRFIFKSTSGQYLSGFMDSPGFCEDPLALLLKYKSTMIPCEMIAIYEKHENMGIDIPAQPNDLYSIINQLAIASASTWSQGMPPNHPVTPLAFFQHINMAE